MRLVFLLAFAATAAEESRFAGEWVAAFKGTTICKLAIEESGSKITGASMFCKISVDQNGELIEGGEPDFEAAASACPVGVPLADVAAIVRRFAAG